MDMMKAAVFRNLVVKVVVHPAFRSDLVEM